MTTVFLTSGTSYTTPADWDNAANTIEVIGGGGGGSQAGNGGNAGGGGGAYSKTTNLTISGSVTYQIGAGGASDTDGTDTWFKSTGDVLAKGGIKGLEDTGGAGGASGSGVGSTKFSGGSGGAHLAGGGGSSGGGGAAGPNGAGKTGGGYVGGGGGGGGGGNGGGANGSDNSGTTGGNGGAAQDSTAGGAGGASNVNGSAGSHGSGGGGGGGDGGTPNNSGGVGGNGVEFDATHGSGGGAGAPGRTPATGTDGANGGNYGGGGSGAASAFTGIGQGGAGANGIICITYTPLTVSGIANIGSGDGLGGGIGAPAVGSAGKQIGDFEMKHEKFLPRFPVPYGMQPIPCQQQQAGYVPTQLRTPTAITASTVTVYTPSGATTGIMRTYNFITTTAHSVFLSIGTDGAGTRIEDSYLLTVNIPYRVNGWFVIPNAVNLQTHADSVATVAPTFGAWGYEWT